MFRIIGLCMIIGSIISAGATFQFLTWAMWQTPWDVSYLVWVQVSLVMSSFLSLAAGLLFFFAFEDDRTRIL